jgi:hypothetical protein
MYACMHVCMYIMHAPTNRHIILYRIPTASTMPARPSMLDLCMSACMSICLYVGWRVDSSVLGSLSADFVSQSSKCPSLNFRA